MTAPGTSNVSRPPQRPREHRRWIATPLLALGFAVVTGCASVDPAPFTQFAASLPALRAGVDTQAGAAADASRAELIEKVADGQVSAADLQLEFDGFATTYGFAESEPNFAKLVNFRQGLSALNDALIAYAQSLAELAGGGQDGDILPSTAEFDQMASDLNANAGTAASALGVSLDPDRQALLSLAAIELFKAYLNNKRGAELGKAIASVQPRVAEFSVAAQQAVKFLASLVETDYNQKVLPLAEAAPPNAMPILALNDTTQATLSMLKSIADSYGALPAAHHDLSAAASKKSTALAGLVALGNETSRLQALITQLKLANQAALATE